MYFYKISNKIYVHLIMINNESMKLCYSTHINVDLFLPPLEKRAYEILAVRVNVLYYKWT